MSSKYLSQCYVQEVGVMNFNDFKRHHCFNPNENRAITFDEIAAKIVGVIKSENGVKAAFEDGSAIFIGFDGSYIRYNRLGQKQSSRKANSITGLSFDDFHVHINVYNKDIFLERFVAVCRDILEGTLLTSYSGLTANVMDGSGSFKTAEYLKIPYNIGFDNIEWCSISKNASHGSKIKKLYEITGHVYRFSAEDEIFDELFKSKDKQKIISYCQNMFYMVK